MNEEKKPVARPVEEKIGERRAAREAQMQNMKPDDNISIRDKLGLTAFGLDQPPLPMPTVSAPEKPKNLPKNVETWLNKSEEKQENPAR